MKTRLTLLLLFIATLANAQYDYYADDEPMFGVGFGHNITSMVGNDVRPTEISLRYRINSRNMVQLIIPIFRQKEAFQSEDHPNLELIETSFDAKKSLTGVGLDYDYALQQYQSLDFVIGLRAEYLLYEYTTDLTNNYMKSSNDLGGAFNATDVTHLDKKTSNYIISPNAGVRLKWNQFAIDAKFLMSMLSIRGDVNHRIETKKPAESSQKSIKEEWTDEISNKFKLKPGIAISVSYFLR